MPEPATEPPAPTVDAARTAANGKPAYVDPIVKYYDGTWFDYRVVWMRNLGMHWGYWDDTTRTHAESLTNMSRALAERTEIKPGMRVLDAGCGVGGPALWLAASYGVNVVGVTLSEVQLGRARKYAAKRGLEHLVRFEIADFTKLPYDDASFDIVWAQESVCHVPARGKQAFLSEASRVLRPGGTMLMEDWFRVSRPYPGDGEELMHEWLAGWAIEDLATRDEITAWSLEAGFAEVDLKDVTPFAYRSIRRLRRLAVWSTPGAALLHGLHLRSDIEQANLRSARLQWETNLRHYWLIGLVRAVKP
ncbi:MAG TPA: methyltransferase domain-containing protein [Actinomycetota bacterium]|nr:methyltransferase domain-containing protein [Actinomycetota bacterium]